MIKSRIAFLAALTVSGGLHAAGAIALGPQPQTIEVAGGRTTTVGLLGEAFEDLAQGAIPVSAATAAPAAAVPPTPAIAAAVPPLPSVTPSPTQPSTAAADLPPPVTQAARPAAPALTPAAQVPMAATAVVPVAPESSPRPVARAEPRKSTSQPAQSQVTTRAGNSDRSARKGSQSGQDSAASAKEGEKTASAPASAAAGNAARANYPGLVLRKIERTRKPSVVARGSVVVSFRISASGALAEARIARSSGDPSLERAALDHIKRAAPFPAPPTGADTDFRFEFVGRK